MSRLAQVFERCKQENRSALVGYLTAGDPDLKTSKELLLTLAQQVDVLEIGMPFSDPMADGPVIQLASERALESGCKIADVFELASLVREANPELGLVLMGYANTPYVIGFDNFSKQAVDAGIDGVLLVDIPPEEGVICDPIFKQNGLDRILLLSPTSTEERIKLVSECASGFIYYVSLTGITGAEMGKITAIQQQVANIRQHTNLPICVGFGVKTPEQATQIANFSDGVVVGSHFVTQITDNCGDSTEMLSSLQSAAKLMQNAVINTVNKDDL
ncbi:MAG: tryptophan synthase subunit alpha [Mariprofundaceae bacterium]